MEASAISKRMPSLHSALLDSSERIRLLTSRTPLPPRSFGHQRPVVGRSVQSNTNGKSRGLAKKRALLLTRSSPQTFSLPHPPSLRFRSTSRMQSATSPNTHKFAPLVIDRSQVWLVNRSILVGKTHKTIDSILGWLAKHPHLDGKTHKNRIAVSGVVVVQSMSRRWSALMINQTRAAWISQSRARSEHRTSRYDFDKILRYRSRPRAHPRSDDPSMQQR